jgi:succinyl-CoA synthetase beta subunit
MPAVTHCFYFSVTVQVTESTDFNKLVEQEPWLTSTRLVVKPDMLFGKRGKSGLVALNLDLAGVESFVKERLGKEVSARPFFRTVCCTWGIAVYIFE